MLSLRVPKRSSLRQRVGQAPNWATFAPHKISAIPPNLCYDVDMVDTHLHPDTTDPLLPDTFAFSQSSLQAFADCARRFWLAYVQQLPWPAIEAAPVELLPWA